MYEQTQTSILRELVTHNAVRGVGTRVSGEVWACEGSNGVCTSTSTWGKRPSKSGANKRNVSAQAALLNEVLVDLTCDLRGSSQSASFICTKTKLVTAFFGGGGGNEGWIFSKSEMSSQWFGAYEKGICLQLSLERERTRRRGHMLEKVLHSREKNALISNFLKTAGIVSLIRAVMPKCQYMFINVCNVCINIC